MGATRVVVLPAKTRDDAWIVSNRIEPALDRRAATLG